MSRNTPSNTDDIIDSRDIIARIEELQDERAALENEYDELAATFDAMNPDADLADYEAAGTAVDFAETALAEWDSSDEAEELKTLQALVDEASDCAPNWQYGATLIRDSYFTDYAEELVKDIGDLPRDLPDYIVIDWKATAENIQRDYSSVDFDGETYWVR